MSDGITDFNRMVEKCKDYDRIKAELESDNWMKNATEFYQLGGCPICFATDEAGHNEGCYIGELESQLKAKDAEIEKLKEYAQHEADCTSGVGDNCSCGLNRVLNTSPYID